MIGVGLILRTALPRTHSVSGFVIGRAISLVAIRSLNAITHDRLAATPLRYICKSRAPEKKGPTDNSNSGSAS